MVCSCAECLALMYSTSLNTGVLVRRQQILGFGFARALEEHWTAKVLSPNNNESIAFQSFSVINHTTSFSCRLFAFLSKVPK